MELIDQHTKKIMEECKERARAAGLKFHGETLEYIVTNRDLVELSPKVMIPTLYDYWVHDVEVIQGKGVYEVYPHNPYETVINTRPAISFYNDNNPDWLNVMIFYHVLAHIDFFQNNIFFKKTWDDDFCGQALADKRLLNRIREELGAEKRWVDYAIEFSRGIDNLVGYYPELSEEDVILRKRLAGAISEKADFYFGEFLKIRYEEKNISLKEYYEEIDRYNECIRQFGEKYGETIFFEDGKFKSKYPEFQSVFEKREKIEEAKSKDILEYLLENSDFLNKIKNRWIKQVLTIIRKTSLFFQPQIRTKIMNEGWASYWHEKLFLKDERIKGHEIDFANINAKVVVAPRVGLNPYVFGYQLFQFIEEMAKKGRLSYRYQLIKDAEQRRYYDENLGDEAGKLAIFRARENLNDFTMVNLLSDEDFQDFVDRYKLFVAGFKPDFWRGVVEVYIKSRSGKDYRQMLNNSLYHPPYIVINGEKAKSDELYLDHLFEGRTLITEYIPAVLRGLEYLWGNTVKLETTEFELAESARRDYYAWLYGTAKPEEKPKFKKMRVLYTMRNKNLSRVIL